MKKDRVIQSKDGIHWGPAAEEPYYPSIVETILHLFGVHQWVYPVLGEPQTKKCVMCGKETQ